MAEVAKLQQQAEEAEANRELFVVMPASQWIEQAKLRPIPKMLFGPLWFENEICILFADTNLGKSILAVQIGDSISTGTPLLDFKYDVQPQQVLYFDFELADKQFENRYSINFEDHYQFNPNFIRVEINPEAIIPNGILFEEFLSASLEKTIIRTGAKVLIIDNLTYLKSETEQAKNALPLMKHLKSLKSKYGLSLLVLAHTPKRDLSKPITRNDLQGSKMLINFCDSSFAIGESHFDKSSRYIKQIKSRNTEIIYDSENVCVCYIEKPHNFLQFDFINFSSEGEHLKEITEKDKAQKVVEVMELKEQGVPNMEIARRYGVSEGAVRKWIKKAIDNKTT